MRCALMLITCMAIAACGSPLAPDTSFRVIGHGGGFNAAVTTGVVNDAAAWMAFIRDSGLRAPSFNPDDPIPAVDFSSETAVALSLGQRPSGGYQIRVERVSREGSTLLVQASELVPCAGPSVITYPLTVIAVTKFSGSVSAAFTRVPCRP